MSDDELSAARVEAGRRHGKAQSTLISRARGAFLGGVEWEKSQSASQSRFIALSEVLQVADSVVPSDPYQIVEVLEALGIEVTDRE